MDYFVKIFQDPVKKNTIANFTGSIWQMLMGLAFIPLYVKLLGIESWGLIGVFVSLQSIFSLFDMGLSSTLNREIARLSILPNHEQDMHDLVHTLGAIYWITGLIIGLIFFILTPYLASQWFHSEHLSIAEIEKSLYLMGLVIVIQMPIGFYSGGLMGLQKQVIQNKINIFLSTFRSVGVLIFMWIYSCNIVSYFIWQIFSSILNVAVLYSLLIKSLPYSKQSGKFNKSVLLNTWKFSIGIFGISILGVILSQSDKIILSKMLSLKMFGYYSLASTLALNLTRITTPIVSAVYPKLTQLISLNDKYSLSKIYHDYAKTISILVVPIVVTIAFYSQEILQIWTNNKETTENSYYILSVLICGTGMYCLMVLPYNLQLAYGWTSLSIYKNIIAISIFIPLLYFLTKFYGAKGASLGWLILNLGYILIEIPIIHSKILIGEKMTWYKNIIKTVIPCITIVGFSKLCNFPFSTNPVYIVLIFFITFLFTYMFVYKKRIII